jgi:chromosome partitioning protein
MICISFVNPKGGTGKTTSCFLLAEQLTAAGYKVAVFDCDPNDNLVTWRDKRVAANKHCPFEIVSGPDEDDLIDQIAAYENKCEILILDMEGTASQIVTFAMSQSDLCLVPFEPTPMETRQAARAVKLVERTSKMIGRKIKYSLVMVRTNAAFQTSDEKDVRQSLNGVSILKSPLVRRAAYTRIFRDAELLSELNSTNVSNVSKATRNAREFATDVIELLGS